MKILIIQTAFIGDVILATPLVDELTKKYLNLKIDFLVRKGNESILENNPNINEIFVFNKKKKIKEIIRLLGIFQSKNYDLVYNIQRFFSSGLLTVFCGAKERIGFSENPLSFLFHKSVPYAIKDWKKHPRHEIQRNLSLMDFEGDTDNVRPSLFPSTKDFLKVKQEGEYVCIAPFSVWFTKQLPLEQWVKVVEMIPTYLKVHIVGAPSDYLMSKRLSKMVKGRQVINLVGKLTLLESTALIKFSKITFSNDSSVTHIASATNTPTITIYCSTVPAFGFSPLATRSSIVQHSNVLSCKPCGLHGKKTCPKKHFNCANIDFEHLGKSIQKILSIKD